MFLSNGKTTINTMGIRYFTCTEGSIYNVAETYHIQVHYKGSHIALGFDSRAQRNNFYDEMVRQLKGKPVDLTGGRE